MVPDQSALSRSSTSSDHTRRRELSEHVLHLLSTTTARDISTMDLAEKLMSGDATTSISVQLDVAIEDALRNAMELWDANTKFEVSEGGSSAFDYTRTWFEWPIRAGLGRFCPITKIAFGTRVHGQVTLDLLRVIRRDWRTRLEWHIKKDASIDLTDDELQNAVDETIGIYFARQLAMQADEEQSAALEPWIEMVQKSLKPR